MTMDPCSDDSLVRGVIPGLEWMHLTVLPVTLAGVRRMDLVRYRFRDE